MHLKKILRAEEAQTNKKANTVFSRLAVSLKYFKWLLSYKPVMNQTGLGEIITKCRSADLSFLHTSPQSYQVLLNSFKGLLSHRPEMN